MMANLLKNINQFLSVRTDGKRRLSVAPEKERIPPLVYALESPQLQFLKLHAVNRFRGFVLDIDDRPVYTIEASLDGRRIGRFEVGVSSEDISAHVPHMASARNCRFDFELYVDGNASRYQFDVIYADGTRAIAFEYNVLEVRRAQRWLRQMARRLTDVPEPPPDLVYLTQGIHDGGAYQNSIIPGIYNLKRYLRDSGVNTKRLRAILDLGCGTGRLAAGWHMDHPRRRLFGCDINAALVNWARENLPTSIHWAQSALRPPLPYPSHTFDLVYLVSVFTHLSSAFQDLWREELERIVRPGGYVLMTLQGEVYVRIFHPQRGEEFSRTGYLETGAFEEGSNAFGAYHSFQYVERVFERFEIVGYYPRGWIRYPEVIFPVAAFQDVYVLRRRLARG